MSESPYLFRPLPMRGLTLPNRIVVAPMHQYSAVDGIAQDWHLQHLLSLSAGGPALIVAEVTAIEPNGRITPSCAGLYSDAGERAYAYIVEAVKWIGLAKIGVQISHAGRKASHREPWIGEEVPADEPWPTISASPVSFSSNWPAPRAADGHDFARLVDAFVDATLRAQRAGFDLIELHAAHGYLLHQFLSPLTNLRRDEYGGSLENRMRFPLQVISAVRRAWPSDKPMGMRVSATDWVSGGFEIDDAIRFVVAAQAEGVDYVCVSSGGIVAGSAPPATLGHHVRFAAKLRKETGAVTRAVGMIVDPHQAEAILVEGQADLIALARAVLDDPRWVWHAADALGGAAACPPQYLRCRPNLWPGAAMRRSCDNRRPDKNQFSRAE
jgi:2,4-dienoyl-CoA reductase-like NADH-dependent reductase (Old Yellow Enzyme family)